MNAIISIWLGIFILVAVFVFLMRGMLDRIGAIEEERMRKPLYFCQMCGAWFISTMKWHDISLVQRPVFHCGNWIQNTDRIPVTLELCAVCYKKKQAEDKEKQAPA